MKKILIVVIAMGFLGACDFLMGPEPSSGNVTIRLGSGNGAARAAISDAVIATLRYEVEFRGPGGETINRSVEPGTETISLTLALGEWTVNARAYTPGNVLAGTGTVTITVPVSGMVLIPMNTSAEVSAKAITAFSVTGPVTAEGTIDEGAKTVTINVPYGTDVIGMITAITHTGASVSPAPGTAVDFSAPQTFTVTAADGTTQPYTVTVNAAPFIPVTNITGVPAAATAGTGLTLTGTVVPSNATNQTISWSVKTAGTTGATISGGNTLNTTAAGTAVVTATIASGLTASGDYTQDFSITVSSAPGTMATYTGDSITFRMAYVPGGVTFPTGRDDSGTGTVTAAYEIGETEVTYELWHAVRAWAESNGYTFYNNPGREGGSPSSENTTPGANKQEPVTMVTWFDAVVWLNALTEWVNVKEGKNLTPVYYYESGCTTVARDSDPSSNFEKEDSSHSCASAYAKSGASGFRLPSSNEWELAARWRNDAVNTVSGYTNPYFTQGDSASGAVADYNDTTANDAVAWWHSGNASKTQAVKGKGANALGLYDMSGNVLEWCYDWSPSYIGSSRIMRGGSWIMSAGPLQVGYVYSFYPETRIYDYGFRPARTAN